MFVFHCFQNQLHKKETAKNRENNNHKKNKKKTDEITSFKLVHNFV